MTVDAPRRMLQAQGLSADPPQDAPWGERIFHMTDPDGHELSFAQTVAYADDNKPVQPFGTMRMDPCATGGVRSFSLSEVSMPWRRISV